MQNILVQTNMKNIFIFDIFKNFHIRKIAYEKDFQNSLMKNISNCFWKLFQTTIEKVSQLFLKVVANKGVAELTKIFCRK